MILHPAVIALIVGSILIGLMALYASFFGFRVIKQWNLSSGSELQLKLEKKTYLISTLITYAFGFQVLAFFLFVFTADSLHRLFVGAMCAAGTLNVNPYGYPTLLLNILNCLLGGIWLIVNYVDNRAFDYPLIRKKYVFLLVLTPLLIVEAVLQGAYFLGLKANVITSCCGSLFSEGIEGVASGLAGLQAEPMMAAFFALMFLTLLTGLHFYKRDSWSGMLFSITSLVTFIVSVAALISFISLYFYALPTHHCPFCILQKEYLYSGYLIYSTLMGGAIAGSGVGVLTLFRSVPSLEEVIPLTQRKLTKANLILYSIFTALVIYQMIFSDLILIGY